MVEPGAMRPWAIAMQRRSSDDARSVARQTKRGP